MDTLFKLFFPENDKLLHFYYGTSISIIMLFITLFGINLIFVPLVTTLIAVGKETYDLYYKGAKFDYVDLLYTITPSILLYLYLIIK